MTTHVFIVDANTFKFHLEYGFAGTGAKEEIIDFVQTSDIELNSTKENSILSMIADSQRVRIGDFILFYLQQNFKEKIFEGKFYGVFRVKHSTSFLDNNDENQFLKKELGKSLTFRTLIEPYQVYEKGVTEWEALDEIKNIQSPCQMLWSLIYRKLKGNRGNTMITIYESERLINLIRNKNNRKILNGNCFSYDTNNQTIKIISSTNNYCGRQTPINIFPRLFFKYNKKNQFETHLQAYILQNIESLPIFLNEKIEWIGNEVSCGVGMQRIDIMLSTNTTIRKVIPIELKSKEADFDIFKQIQRYVNWIEQYYLPNRPSDIEPMIISLKIDNKNSSDYKTFISELINFNQLNNILKVRYIEFEIFNYEILFNEIIY